eukprot:Rmarinus@m.1239
MGNKSSKATTCSSPFLESALSKFEDGDVERIRQTFKSLSVRRTPQAPATIAKSAFLEAFSVVQYKFADRLFNLFDTKRTGVIDYEEFVCGLSICCRGTVDEKIEWVFNVHDINDTGSIDREDLTSMLSGIPPSALKMLLIHDVENDGLPHLVGNILSEFGKTKPGSLSLPEFKEWIVASDIISVIEAVPPYSQIFSNALEHLVEKTGESFGGPDKKTKPKLLRTKSESAFMHEEVAVLKQMFKDAAKRSKGKTVDKATFLTMFPLPSLMGERLFTMFDTKKTGVLDCEEFIAGFFLCLRGSEEKRTKFIFDMYDLRGDGSIHPAELVQMLRHLSYESLMELHRSAEVVRLERLRRRMGSQSFDKDGLRGSLDADSVMRHGSAPPDFLADEIADFVIDPEAVASEIFDTFDLDNNQKLSYSQFKLWLDRAPEVLRILGSVVTEEIFDDLRDSGVAIPTSMSTPPSTPQTPNKHPQSPLCPYPSPQKVGEAHALSQAPCMPTAPVGDGDSGPSLPSSFADRVSPQASPLPVLAVPTSSDKPPSGSLEIMRADSNDVTKAGDFQLDDGISSKAPSPGTSRRSLFFRGRASSNSKRKQTRQGVIKEGALYKKGSKLKMWTLRWCVLRKKYLYVYGEEMDLRPRSVILVSGSLVNLLDAPCSEGYYGFEILTSVGGEKASRVFYTKTESERSDWVQKLTIETNVIRFEDRYNVGEKIGCGLSADIHLATRKETGEKFALKVIDKASLTESRREFLRTEICVLRLLNHPNVVRCEEICESPDKMYIVLEYVAGGDLFEQLREKWPVTEDIIRSTMYSLLDAIHCLHSNGVVHRDIKPENILCEPDFKDLKLADFGLSTLFLPDEVLSYQCGTIKYCAPEVLDGSKGGYDKAADLWSAGIILYLMIHGCTPFQGETDQALRKAILRGRLNMKEDGWRYVCAEAKDLCVRLLQVNAGKRLSAQDALSHPFFSTILKPERKVEAPPVQRLTRARSLDSVTPNVGATVAGPQEEQSVSEIRRSVFSASPSTRVPLPDMIPVDRDSDELALIEGITRIGSVTPPLSDIVSPPATSPLSTSPLQQTAGDVSVRVQRAASLPAAVVDPPTNA